MWLVVTVMNITGFSTIPGIGVTWSKHLLDEGMTLRFISPAQISPLNLFGAPPNLLCIKWTTNLPLQIYCFHRFVNFSFFFYLLKVKVQFSSVTQSCPTLCNPMDCSISGLPVHHQLLELTLTHVHRVGNAVQPSHFLSSPSPPAFNLSHHQGLFQWVSFSHQVAKVLEFQLQRQSFQWIFRTHLL